MRQRELRVYLDRLLERVNCLQVGADIGQFKPVVKSQVTEVEDRLEMR